MTSGIRAWRIGDAPDLAEALNNKKIHDNLRDGLPFPYTASDAEDYIRSILEAPKDSQYCWAVTVDDKAVGSIGVFRGANVHRLTAELGYYLAEPYWGKGMVAGAVKEACRILFETTDLLRIFADPYGYNKASCRVLEKSGFAFEGILRKNAVKNGKVLDMHMYALVK